MTPGRSEEVLAAIDHDAAQAILRFREADGQRKQAESFLEKIAADGRIHADFDPLGAVTGRFGCSDPNLQAVKRGKLREAFVAPEGQVLLLADYSQIELRAAAALAPDEAMLRTFAHGGDIHTATAALIKDCPEVAVSKADRQLAKACNFGLIYGMSAQGLAKYARSSYGVEISESEANDLREKFFMTYAGLAKWHQRIWSRIHGQVPELVGEVRTVLGRRRLLPSSAEAWTRFTAMTNTLVQGTTADGLKMAMLRLATELPEQIRLIATVHDEVIYSAPIEQAPEALAHVKRIMVAAMQGLLPNVTIEVGANIAANWSGK